MNDHLIFIAQITEKTGITYNTILKVYKESELTGQKEICQLFMDKFQLSFGFAHTLADIILEEEG